MIWFFSYCCWSSHKYFIFSPHVVCHYVLDIWQLFLSKKFHQISSRSYFFKYLWYPLPPQKMGVFWPVFSFKEEIVSPWDFFAYKWTIPYESEMGSCWNFTLRKSFHFAGFHLFLIKKVHNIIITLKVHVSQTLHCNQWFFYLLDYSSNFEVSFFPWIIFLWVSPAKTYLN